MTATILAAIAYTIGLVAELSGALLVIAQARAAQRPRPGAPSEVIDKLTRYRDVMRVRTDMDELRQQQIPTPLAIGLLLAGILFGYAGCFISLA